MSNSVKLYSNGTALINRIYAIPDQKPLEISIPVQKSDLDEVVASIAVFGNVTLPEPPSYTPINAYVTPIQIDVNNVIKSLATKLSGSSVEVGVGNNPINGKLMGIQTYQEELNLSVFDRYRVVVLTEQGVKSFGDKEVRYISFTDPAVKLEIEKALQQQFESIKPNSSFINLKLVPQDDAKSALISYAIPCAAWKIRYQLRTVDGKVELEGQAVVDNDTDDDWRDSIISVITGEPIAFSTDLAEIRRPIRERINVVSDKATGVVKLDEAQRSNANSRQYAKSAMRSMAQVCSIHSGTEVVDGGTQTMDDEVDFEGAVQQQAEVRDSGDFSIFTSPSPVTILSKRSAIIPMFRVFLKDSKTVLFYKEDKDQRRPFRSIQLKNETDYTLGKGICEVFLDNDFQGKCILETCKSGEDVILVHAKETGVKIFKKAEPVEQRRISIKFNKGRILTEESYRQRVSYSVENAKPEEFQLALEYKKIWQGSTITASDGVVVTQTANGVRLCCKLAPNGDKTVKLVETYTRSLVFGANSQWLEGNIFAIEHPLSKNNGINKCGELQTKITDLYQQINENEEQVEAIKEEQIRLKDLIPSAHADQANSWKSELGENETKLRSLTRTENPRLKKEVATLEKEIADTLASLTVTWEEELRQ